MAATAPPTRVSVFGLGKLGAPLVTVLAEAGHEVIGVDINERTVALVNGGVAPVLEPGLQEGLTRAAARVRATTDARAAILGSDVTFIITPTPSMPDGSFSLEHIVAALRVIGTALAEKRATSTAKSTSRHAIVITSTVLPGSTSGALRTALESSSGGAAGVDFDLVYSPMFIALGSVLDNMRRPDLVLVGEVTPGAGERVESILRTFQTGATYCRMAAVNAEISKLAVNTYVTTKISYANMLAEMCERTPGANVDVVTAAIGQDTRIGPKYLRGAVAYGGPCFPRDNAAFAAAARSVGAQAGLAEATDLLNRHQAHRLEAIVEAHVPTGATVSVLGLAYKQDTDVIEQSPGLALARRLVERGLHVKLYDPLAGAAAAAALPGAALVADAAGALDADAVVITTPAAVFRTLPWADTKATRAITLIDCWRIVDAQALPAHVTYVRLGVGGG